MGPLKGGSKILRGLGVQNPHALYITLLEDLHVAYQQQATGVIPADIQFTPLVSPYTIIRQPQQQGFFVGVPHIPVPLEGPWRVRAVLAGAQTEHPPPSIQVQTQGRARVNEWLPRVHRIGVFQAIGKGAQVQAVMATYRGGRMPVLWVLIATSNDDTYVGLQYAQIQQPEVPIGTLTQLLWHPPPPVVPEQW